MQKKYKNVTAADKEKHLRENKTKPFELQLRKGPIYTVLHEHLLENGCLLAAKNFQELVAIENDLYQTDMKFKKRLRDAHCLLLAVVENVKTAEQAYKSTGENELSLKMLIQTVHMIQVQDDAFHWLVKEMYRRILEKPESWDDGCEEMLARVHFEYGVVLTEKGDNHLNEAIVQFSLALEGCKGTMWYTNEKDRNFLHEDICVKLCETLLRQAKIDSKKHPKMAADLAYKAVLTVMEVGVSTNKDLYCVAKLRQAEYLIASGDNEGAMAVLNNVHNDILANDNPRNKCEFYLWLGICNFKIGSPHSLALRKFKLSLSLSETYNFADLRADGLLYLGKIHAQDPSTQTQARQCFIEAKELYQRLRDFENEKLAKFLMAKLKAYQIFPNYIELIKKASWSSYCYLFDLIQWKQKMLPFWDENDQLRTYENECQCLLMEDIEKEVRL